MRHFFFLIFLSLTVLGRLDGAGDWRDLMRGAAMRKGPASGRTHVICQAQLKYGLKPYDSYYDRWVDYPLFVNPELTDPATHKAVLHFPDYAKMQRIAKSYGLEGFAMFPNYFAWEHTVGLWKYNEKIADPEFRLVPLLHPVGKEFEQYTDLVVKSPGAFLLKGKNVFPLFGSPENQMAKKKFLTEKYGDRFLFFAYFNINALHDDFYFPQFGYREKRMTKEYAALFMEKLREHLRRFDGILLEDAWAMNLDHGLREPYWDFYRDFVLRALKAVYAEKEFQNKYLWMSAFCGHENPSFVGYHSSSNGTRNLRRLMEAAMDAGADIVNIGEWDEQNENTSLRPTVYNSGAHLRIMRYYTNIMKGKKQTPLPGDSAALPNLIFSARKTVAAGEMIRMELLNVPDGGPKERYSVILTLSDMHSGREVFRSRPMEFDSGRLMEMRQELPSEDYAMSRALLPGLRIQREGKPEILLQEGLLAIDLRPVWTWDYKWAKQPVRDVAWDIRGSLRKLDAPAEGEQRFSFTVFSPDKIANCELLDNQLTVYSHSRPGTPLCRETDETLVFRVSLLGVQEKENYADMVFSLDKGALNAITRTRMWRDEVHKAVQTVDGKVVCTGLAARWIAPVFFLAAERKNLDSVLNVGINGAHSYSIPLKELCRRQAFGISLPKGVSLVISRYLQQWDHPAHLNTKKVECTVNTLPSMPDSLFYVQIVTADGKVWRSRPCDVRRGDNGTQKTVTVWSETAGKAIDVSVPAYRVSDLVYEPDPAFGTLLATPAGRMLWGIRGGFVQQAIGRGGCENDCYGNVFSDGATCQYYPKNTGSPAPELFRENGRWAMKFNGVNSFLSLPQGVIPKRAGFELSMRIRPESISRKQFLLGNTNSLFGGGLQLLEINPGNLLQGEFINQNMEITSADNVFVFSVPNTMKPGEWNDFRMVYDLENFQFFINGRASSKYRAPGPARFDTTTSIGGFRTFFAGDIMDLRIRHAK